MATTSTERFGQAVDTRPAWFEIVEQGRTRLRGTATVDTGSAEGDVKILLDVGVEISGVRVRETVPGTRFPARCPERHIEQGGWFCLGLSSGWLIRDKETATEWWLALASFLDVQRVADRLKFWPDQHALSHGAAGHHHRRALHIAASIGLSDDYDKHLLEQPSIIDAIAAKVAKTGDRLINGRLPCPCGRSDSTGRPILRRKCPRRSQVIALLAEERRRVMELDRYWATLRTAGVNCCGKMKSCRLASE